MKMLIYPKNIEEIEKTKTMVDGYIIGIKDMSINANMYIDDLSILNSIKGDIFISNPWEIGDFYAYCLHTKKAQEYGLKNKYIYDII